MSKNETARRMKLARTMAGLTQAEVAERAGLAAPQYWRIESEGSCVLSTAARIAAATGASLDFIAGLSNGDEEMQRRASILSQIEELKAQL